MRLLFIGTTPFAVPSLHTLYEASSREILAVVTQPDRPQGRGGKLSTSPVKEAALKLSLPIFQPEKVRSKEFVQTVRDMAPDVIDSGYPPSRLPECSWLPLAALARSCPDAIRTYGR